MAVLEVAAHAKINLSLDVLRKREDGYHDLRMIMQTVELHDTVRLEAVSGGISLECNNRRVPQDGTNTAWKAADLLMSGQGIKSGVRITIIKRIPVAAGLAGGSADAAAVLRGLNDLFMIGLESDDLRRLGKQVGADVPFCIDGGTRLAEGIGERLTALEDFSGVDIILVKPEMDVSTAWVYAKLKISEIADCDRPDINLVVQALAKQDIKTVAGNMKNVLEEVTIPKFGIIREAKERLIEFGALGSIMSGSGPTVFGIFSDSATAATAYRRLTADSRWKCFYTRTTAKVSFFDWHSCALQK